MTQPTLEFETPPQELPPVPPPGSAPGLRRLAAFAGVALARAAWAGLILAAAMLLIAVLLPQDFSDTSWPYRWLVMVGFALRALQVHVGIACVVAAVAGAGLRRRWLALAGVGLAGVLLAGELMNLTRWPRLDRPAGETVRIMSANLYFKNTDDGSILHAVFAADADVLVFQEVTPFHARLLQTKLAEAYPHQLVEPQTSPGGSAILSKRPFRLAAASEVPSGMGPRQLRELVFEINGQDVSMHAVHLASPGSPRALAWNRLQTATLLEAARDRRLPMLMVGDFNFTERNAQHHALEAAGMTSAYTQAGIGRFETWRPGRNRGRFVPGVRIDHAFTSPELTVTHLAAGQWTGSDHRPIIIEVGLRAGK
ncbi:MAG: endonuclease/exonuclease/phosphatase family protein [Phycisphaerae bacterium]